MPRFLFIEHGTGMVRQLLSHKNPTLPVIDGTTIIPDPGGVGAGWVYNKGNIADLDEAKIENITADDFDPYVPPDNSWENCFHKARESLFEGDPEDIKAADSNWKMCVWLNRPLKMTENCKEIVESKFP